MARKLTARQEKFCQGIADGLNQSDAYRSAYTTEKTPVKKIWESASKLADQGKVEARINEIKAVLVKKQLWTKEMSVKILGSIALKPAALDNNKIAAIRELNLMHGFNAANGDLDSYVLPVKIIREPVDGRKISGQQPAG